MPNTLTPTTDMGCLYRPTTAPAKLVRVSFQSAAQTVEQRLADLPEVWETLSAAATAARGLPGAQPHAMAHSWLFTGPPGSGRSYAALDFAALLMCTGSGSGRPLGCGECENCRAILEEHSHTDLVFIEPQELSISVATARQVISKASTMPTVSEWRVVIFDNADRLSGEAANALLKTVEEPPERTVLIMCAPSADPEDFSQTLRSRCRHLYIPSPSVEEIVRLLSAEGAAPDDARLAAHASMRNIGRARHLVFDVESQKLRAMSINLAEDVFHGSGSFHSVTNIIKAVTKAAKESFKEADEAEVEKLRQAYGAGGKGKGAAKAQHGLATEVKELEKLQKKRETRRLRDLLDLVLIDLAGIYRDALMSGSDVPATHPDFAPLAAELAKRFSDAQLVAAQDAIKLCREHIGHNVSPQIAFDAMVGRLRQLAGVR